MGFENEGHFLDSDSNDDLSSSQSVILPSVAADDGIWSIVLPPNKGPSPRTGHFFCILFRLSK